MSGTTKAVLSICVLLLAALVVYYGMTPAEELTLQPRLRDSKQQPMFSDTSTPHTKTQPNLSEHGSVRTAAQTPHRSAPDVPPAKEVTLPFTKALAKIAAHSVAEVLPEKGTRTTRRYEVQVGETLGEIAKKELGNFKEWRKIAALNGIDDPSRIMPGMVLQLPARDQTPSTAKVDQSTKPSVASKQTGTTIHTVVEGDTLSSIAETYYGNANLYSVIAKANPSVDPDRLSIGTHLKIPTQ